MRYKWGKDTSSSMQLIVITIVLRQKAVDCRTFESFRNDGIYLWDRRGYMCLA